MKRISWLGSIIILVLFFSVVLLKVVKAEEANNTVDKKRQNILMECFVPSGDDRDSLENLGVEWNVNGDTDIFKVSNLSNDKEQAIRKKIIQESSRYRLLAMPRKTTLDDMKCIMNAGTNREDVLLALTPHITEEGDCLMKISVNITDKTPEAKPLELSSLVMIKKNETALIAILRKTDKYIFSRRGELEWVFFFITPRIMAPKP